MDVLIPIPGPETSSGKTSMPAPTVFPVIMSDVDITGSKELSKKFESKTDLSRLFEDSQSSANDTAERLSILRLAASSVFVGCILSGSIDRVGLFDRRRDKNACGLVDPR